MIGIEEALKKDGICMAKTVGNSMNPMLVEGRDTVVIVPPAFPLHRLDIPVYRRGDHYTMHRIVDIQDGRYIICGDNRTDKEYDITERDIIGVLIGYYRGNRYINLRTDRAYRRYARRVCALYPFRVLRAKLRLLKNS